jgi:hypothetical protein
MSKPQGPVEPRGLDKLKNSFTSSGLEHVTLRLVAQSLKHYATACSNVNITRDNYSAYDYCNTFKFIVVYEIFTCSVVD